MSLSEGAEIGQHNKFEHEELDSAVAEDREMTDVMEIMSTPDEEEEGGGEQHSKETEIDQHSVFDDAASMTDEHCELDAEMDLDDADFMEYLL